ncbi:MAG: LysR family transcriptional regulator [Actinotalea sp.]|nr:LysR family transcriptional regulator [Actinotalea sp.]
MDLQDLEAFLAVVDHHGFRRAADALFVSQPSLTRRVARLEQDLKVQLLDRGPRGIELTRHGEALVSGARRLLASADETRSTVSGDWSDSIVLASTTTSVGRYLTDFLASWIPNHASTRVSMVEGGPRRTRRRLADHECDAAIVATPLDREFDSLPVARAQVQALIRTDHRLAGQGLLSVAELDREPVVGNGDEYLSGQLLRSACRVAGVQPQIVFQCSVGQTLAALAQAGLGVAVLSSAVQRHDEGLVVRPLCGADGHPLEFDLHVAWVRGRVLNPVLHQFVQDLSTFTAPMRA